MVADKTAESLGERSGDAYADATTNEARERRAEFFGTLRPRLRQAARLYPGRSTNKPLSRSSRPSHSVMLPQC